MTKYFLPLLLATGMFSACNTSTTKQVSQADSAATETQSPSSPRKNLVAAFEELETSLADGSGQQLAARMSFPVPEEIFAIFSEDSAFNAAYNAANRTMSKPLFLEFFPQIAESLQLQEFRELFRQVAISKLLTSDSLHGEIRKADEACLQYYSIQLNHDTATISYGSDHNDTYKQPGEDDEEPVCEWATIWEFHFDGRHLRFLRMFQAG